MTTLRRRYNFACTPESLIFDSDISDRAVRLWCMLDRYAGAGTATCPSRIRLANDLRCSDRTVDAAANELIRAGYLEVHSGRSNGVTNEYVVAIPEEGAKPTSQGCETGAAGGAKPTSHREERSREKERTTPTGLPETSSGNHLTVNQRAERLATVYYDQQPMARLPAILGIAKKAIQSERYTDEQIHVALLRLADEGRSVTVETLRLELDGMPPPRDRGQEATDDMFQRAMARAQAREAGAP